MGIAEILGAMAGGGATGLLGSLVNSVGDFFKMREKNRHDEKMAEVETRHLEMEIERDVVIAKQEAAAQMEEQAARTQEASYKSDARSYLPAEAVKSSAGLAWLMAVADFFRGIIRPALTLFLVIVAWQIYMQTNAIVAAADGGLSADQAYDLLRTIIIGLLYLTFTAVGWWFGSRSKFDKIFKL